MAAADGHFTLTDYFEHTRRVASPFAQRLRPFSVLTPLPALVQALNDFRPAVLVGYPTIMQLLAQEQQAGRLQIAPLLVSMGGEYLTTEGRTQIATAFRCLVQNNYGASEFMHIAFECRYAHLHLNADWVILEPVDAAYHPVPPGQASHTTLLTNLANLVQPLIRYDLGDRITISPDPCQCGNPLPTLQVEGRRDDFLRLPVADGKVILLSPMALSTVVEETPGIRTFQLIQTAPTTLRIRLTMTPESEEARVWTTLAERLRTYLASQGIPSVTLERDAEAPKPHSVSGKFRHVWIEDRSAASVR